MSGVSTSVEEGAAVHSLLLKDGDDQDFIITRHSQFCIPINVLNWYGEQETHNSKEYIENKWLSILKEIKRIERLEEGLIIAGDLNKHVGNIVPENKTKVSTGGKLLRDFLENDNYVLLNASKKAKGGPFTRYNPVYPSDEEAKSCLDLVIVSKNIEKYVKSMKIDKDRLFTPFRVVKNELKYTDHYSVLVEMEIPQR